MTRLSIFNSDSANGLLTFDHVIIACRTKEFNLEPASPYRYTSNCISHSIENENILPVEGKSINVRHMPINIYSILLLIDACILDFSILINKTSILMLEYIDVLK